MQVRNSREIKAKGKRNGAGGRGKSNFEGIEMLGSDLEDFEMDDNSTSAIQGSVRYAI